MSGWLTSREEYLDLVAVYARKARRSIHAGDYWNARRNATQAVRCYRRAEARRPIDIVAMVQ